MELVPFSGPSMGGLTNIEAAGVLGQVERGMMQREVRGTVPEVIVEVRAKGAGRWSGYLAQGEVYRVGERERQERR